MKRAALTLGLALLAPPAAAQWLGEPTWNAPTAGSGFTIYGDYSRPNTDAGGGNPIGGPVMLGAGPFTPTRGGVPRMGPPPSAWGKPATRAPARPPLWRP